MKTDCCCPPSANPMACGCCEGTQALTPLSTANRPGLPAISYRIGTHATFLETMKTRLSSHDFPKLAELTTREADDPAIALLDAWAVVADVLTFYQERIANEGYLRTALERRSVLELARLVGYQPRPGVASSVHLAYTIDPNFKEETLIPKSSRSQSVPGPGELPQSFETSEDLKALAQWNNLKPRLTRPQTPDTIDLDRKKAFEIREYKSRVYLKGISTNLKPNDPLLIDFDYKDKEKPMFYRVKEVIPDPAKDRTLVTLQRTASDESSSPPVEADQLINALTRKPSVQSANKLKLERNLNTLFLGSGVTAKKASAVSEEVGPRLMAVSEGTPAMAVSKAAPGLMAGEASHAVLKAFSPVLRKTLATAVGNARVTEENPIKVYALRVKASLFGHNAPRRILEIERGTGRITQTGEWPVNEEKDKVYLNANYEFILPETWVVIDTSSVSQLNGAITIPDENKPRLIAKVGSVQSKISRAEYGISGETTCIELASQNGEPPDWIKIATPSAIGIHTHLTSFPQEQVDRDFHLVRRTVVYAQSEELELAEEPIEEALCGGSEQLIELDGLYEGLESGRWVIVSGERDLPGTSGVRFSELAIIATVTQNVGTQVKEPKNGFPWDVRPGDKTRTFISLDKPLAYCFKRDTAVIYGNVVKATHGETRKEVLGSGDGARALQSFTLKQPPLTYVSAPNPSGVDSTLKVFVNDVEWHEADALAGLSPVDHHFITKTDDEAKTTVVFGNGREGARLPTGMENIKAVYRNGIGKAGNVKAEQISLLASRPLGVKEVINPLHASGGANKESRDQARKNAPLAVMALDRLVSVQDYEDFCRTYAGIAKAKAVEISDGRRQIVHITIAGAVDIPIDENSDLYSNLRQALLDFGDPHQAIRLEIRELMLIVISARVRILPDYQWETVEPRVRAAVLDAFSFERRELGQDVLLSEVISVMQSVRGVAYVDVEIFGGLPEKKATNAGTRELLAPEEIARIVEGLGVDSEGIKKLVPDDRIPVHLAEIGTLFPSQIAYLSPDVPETLILNQII